MRYIISDFYACVNIQKFTVVTIYYQVLKPGNNFRKVANLAVMVGGDG
jgi:hypothetical protein